MSYRDPPKQLCSTDDCGRPVHGHGLCHRHWQLARRRGLLQSAPTPEPAERFWAKVNKTETCWLWTASVCNRGYGRFGANRRVVRAHRFAFELAKGPVPPGMVLDHLCRVRHCVNPDHLEAVTDLENWLRGETMIARSRWTHCARGHSFADAIARRDGRRECRTCHNARNSARYYRLRSGA